MSPVAEEKGPDQREDANFARTGAPLQQGAQAISWTLLVLFSIRLPLLVQFDIRSDSSVDFNDCSDRQSIDTR